MCHSVPYAKWLDDKLLWWCILRTVDGLHTTTMANAKWKSKGSGAEEDSSTRRPKISIEDAAKRAASKRAKKASTPNQASSLTVVLLRSLLVGVGVAVAVFSLLLLVAPYSSSSQTTDTITSDSEQWSKAKDFLDNFVCRYRPDESVVNARGESVAINEHGGYCHPRLSTIPQQRTQYVSSIMQSAPSSSTSVTSTVLNNIMNRWATLASWAETVFPQPQLPDIPAGELVLKLPRPLQIWDLDALRDEFVQREFLGLSSTSGDGSKSTRRVARHKDTQNLLDSGAYLAVYLIRLLHGSRSTQQSDHESGQECSEESGECKATDFDEAIESNKPIHWTDITQHKERIPQLSAYLEILPSYSDRIAKLPPSASKNLHDHPLTWTHSSLESLFPKYTPTYDLIEHHRQMAKSEYDALKLASPDEFGKNVNFTEYLGMRINVLSRAFGLAVSDHDNGVLWSRHARQDISLDEEMKLYDTSNFGAFVAPSSNDTQTKDGVVSLETYKLRSMCPLLDMYNSHPHPNVLWRYDSKTSSYLINANRGGITTGHSIMVSYGKYTEGHLFAKYGYVNGDGSSPTQANVAAFHRLAGDVGLGRQYSPLPFHVWDRRSRVEISQLLANMGPEVQKSFSLAKRAMDAQAKELLRYLMFDDGYQKCIVQPYTKNNNDGNNTTSDTRHWELKVLKLRHLIRIANNRDMWSVRLPPKYPDALPRQPLPSGEQQVNTKKPKENKVGIDANRILSTCRLTSLTVDDMDGDAIKHLKEGLSSEATSTSSSSKSSFFHVKKDSNALEYRALMCVVRLSDAAIDRYGKFAQQRGNLEPEMVGSREWTAWYIRDGELRLLHILRQTAGKEANRLRQSLTEPSSALFVRNKACPIENSLPLLDELSLGSPGMELL
jgi:hypothetical protein